MKVQPLLPGGALSAGAEESPVLTPGALAFLGSLAQAFHPALRDLLQARRQRQAGFDRGERPGFDPASAPVREADWTVAPLPAALLDRRVEITTPPDPRALIEALNSGARTAVADFEDGLAPTLDNLLGGQRALAEAVRGTLRHEDPATGQVLALGNHVAGLMVRPRGLHLPERHLEVEGEPIPACLFDAGLFLFHNGRALAARGEGPFLCLAKLEHPLEARWWNAVLARAEAELGLEADSVRVTVLVETLPAAFAMDEILHELRGRAAGLGLGGRDYLFSFIKARRAFSADLLPDRGGLRMDQAFLRACARLLVATCHRRGCLALGDTSAYAPSAQDPQGAARALDQVRADKLREVLQGFDGAWVAHPALVPVAREPFDAHLPGPNQADRILREPVSAEDLLEVPQGKRTERGLRHDLKVAIRYLDSWLRGRGRVDLYGYVEDAATAENCRMQVWQWVHHGADLEGLAGPLERPLFHAFVQDALFQIQAEVGEDAFAEGRYLAAADLFETLVLHREPAPFLTLPAYDLLFHPLPLEA